MKLGSFVSQSCNDGCVIHMQSCCFAKINLLLLTVLVAVAVVVAETPLCCYPEILLPW